MGWNYNVNGKTRKPLPGWLPFVAGFALVVQFAGLGGWQVSRGLEKRAQQEMFADDSAFTHWSAGEAVRPYQRLSVSGAFLSDRQVLLDNIILDSRYGYYVLTPLELGDDNALLLVNRGWMERSGQDVDADTLAVPAAMRQLRGRAGSLPRAGYRMGTAFGDDTSWPRRALYPSLDEVAAALGRPVQPFVLLMEPDDAPGFLRYWMPEEMGPGRHFAYALQWFAMGAVLAALLVWHYRRRRQPHD